MTGAEKSVLASQPAQSSAAMSYAGLVESANAQSTCESQSNVTRAEPSHQTTGIAQQSEQSALGCNPVENKANVTATTEVVNTSADGSPFSESSSQKFAAAVVAADSVPIAESDACGIESQQTKSAAAVFHADPVFLKVREILSEPKPLRRLGSRRVFPHSTIPSLFDFGSSILKDRGVPQWRRVSCEQQLG